MNHLKKLQTLSGRLTAWRSTGSSYFTACRCLSDGHISQGKGFFLNYRVRGALWGRGSSVASIWSPTSNSAVTVLLPKLKLERFISGASRKINAQCHCQAVICGTITGIDTSTILGSQLVNLWAVEALYNSTTKKSKIHKCLHHLAQKWVFSPQVQLCALFCQITSKIRLYKSHFSNSTVSINNVKCYKLWYMEDLHTRIPIYRPPAIWNIQQKLKHQSKVSSTIAFGLQ